MWHREPCSVGSCVVSVRWAPWAQSAGVCGFGLAVCPLGSHCSAHLPGAEGLRVEFDRQCSTERRHDPLTVMDGVNRIVSVRSGGGVGGVTRLQERRSLAKRARPREGKADVPTASPRGSVCAHLLRLHPPSGQDWQPFPALPRPPAQQGLLTRRSLQALRTLGRSVQSRRSSGFPWRPHKRDVAFSLVAAGPVPAPPGPPSR